MSEVSENIGIRTFVDVVKNLESITSRGFYFIEDSEASTPLTPFRDLYASSLRSAAALQASGIRRGDRVLLVIPDTRQFITAFLGAIMAGILPVPVYPPTGMARLNRYLATLSSIVARSEARVAVTSSQLHHALLASGAPAPPVITTEELDQSDAEFRPEVIQPDDVAFLQFTSGSTSHPKGVCVTHANLLRNTQSIRDAFRLTRDDVPLTWLPLYHDMGLIGFLMTPLLVTVSTRFLPTQLFLKRPSLWLELISRERATISVAPDFAFSYAVRRMRNMDLDGMDLSSWRIAGCGAEPIQVAHLQEFNDMFAPHGFRSEAFLPMYGLAEATLAVTIPKLKTGLRWHAVDERNLREQQRVVNGTSSGSVRIVACGVPVSGTEVSIFALEDAESSRPLNDLEVGEIRVRGSSVMSRYWNDNESTEAVFAGGYLQTGDLGFLDHGELYVCGRTKELIIVNGRNYFPGDIEHAVSRVAGVRAVMAFQTPASEDGAASGKLVVTVEGASDEPVDLDLVLRAVTGELGLSLDDVVQVAKGELPRTSSGKPRRLEACRMYQAGQLNRIPQHRSGAA